MSEPIFHFMETMVWCTAAVMAWVYHRRIEDLERQVEALKPKDVPRAAQDAWDAEEAC